MQQNLLGSCHKFQGKDFQRIQHQHCHNLHYTLGLQNQSKGQQTMKSISRPKQWYLETRKQKCHKKMELDPIPFCHILQFVNSSRLHHAKRMHTWIPSCRGSSCSFLCIRNFRTKLLHLPSHCNQLLLHHLTMLIVFCESLLLILNGSPKRQ